MFTFFNVALEAYIHLIKCFSISSILISNSTRKPNGDQSLELSSTFNPPNCTICLHTNFWHNLEPNKKHVVSGPFRRFTKIHSEVQWFLAWESSRQMPPQHIYPRCQWTRKTSSHLKGMDFCWWHHVSAGEFVNIMIFWEKTAQMPRGGGKNVFCLVNNNLPLIHTCWSYIITSFGIRFEGIKLQGIHLDLTGSSFACTIFTFYSATFI